MHRGARKGLLALATLGALVVGGAGNARAQDCGAPEAVAACKSMMQEYFDVCQRTDVRHLGLPLDRWFAAVKAYPGLLKRIAAFRRTWGACLTRWQRHGCYLRVSTLDKCERIARNIRPLWGRYVADLTGPQVQRDLTYIKSLRFENSRIHSAKQKVKEYQAVLAMNAHPWLRAPDAPLRAAIAQFQALTGQLAANKAEALAKRRCPKGRGGPAGLRRTLNGVAKRHYERRERGDSFRKRLAVFRLDGPSRLTYERFRRVTHQNQPTIACVKQIYPDRTVCRIFRVTMRRSRVGRGRWSAWRWYSIGGGTEMACKNLR